MLSRRLVTGLFLFLFFGFLIWFNLNKPRVLIVHSYATDFSWVRDINTGINRVLKGKPALVRWYYLDTKRNPDPEYKIRAGAAARKEVLKWKPDIIISIDDNAQDMVAKYFVGSPSINIVFTGINATPQQYGFERAVKSPIGAVLSPTEILVATHTHYGPGTGSYSSVSSGIGGVGSPPAELVGSDSLAPSGSGASEGTGSGITSISIGSGSVAINGEPGSQANASEPPLPTLIRARNVTGVVERIPFRAVHEAFSLINPKGRFVHVCDDSETSKAIQAELEEFDWHPLKLVETKTCRLLSEWQEAIRVANQQADFLLVTHYHTIKADDDLTRTLPPMEVLAWTKNNIKVPMVGCWDFFVEDGGMLSVSVSPFEQGEVAARMAVDIMERGMKPSEIPIYRNTQFTISMRAKELKKFEIKIPMIFEAFARGLNHYYE